MEVVHASNSSHIGQLSAHHYMHAPKHLGRLARLLQPAFSGSRLVVQHHSSLPCRKSYSSTGTIAKGRRGLSELLSIRDSPEESSRTRLKPGTVGPEREVPAHIPRPPYAANYDNPGWTNAVEVHDEEGLKKMRAACKLAAQVLQHAGTRVKPGVRTDEIDAEVHKMIVEAGAYPSPLRYGKFPKSVCTSVNECVCHGIPDSRPLVDGDIVNIDVTVYLNGYHGDTSSMFFCGEVSEKAKRLCQATKEAMEAGIQECRPGAPVKKIGAACSRVAEQYKLSVVAEFCGHGVGKIFHASPVIQHTRNNVGDKMKTWQTFTIEPILCTGSPRNSIWADDWTCVTRDGSLAAQYEHTILVTPDGAEVLTVV